MWDKITMPHSDYSQPETAEPVQRALHTSLAVSGLLVWPMNRLCQGAQLGPREQDSLCQRGDPLSPGRSPHNFSWDILPAFSGCAERRRKAYETIPSHFLLTAWLGGREKRSLFPGDDPLLSPDYVSRREEDGKHLPSNFSLTVYGCTHPAVRYKWRNGVLKCLPVI